MAIVKFQKFQSRGFFSLQTYTPHRKGLKKHLEIPEKPKAKAFVPKGEHSFVSMDPLYSNIVLILSPVWKKNKIPRNLLKAFVHFFSIERQKHDPIYTQ